MFVLGKNEIVWLLLFLTDKLGLLFQGYESLMKAFIEHNKVTLFDLIMTSACFST